MRFLPTPRDFFREILLVNTFLLADFLEHFGELQNSVRVTNETSTEFTFSPLKKIITAVGAVIAERAVVAQIRIVICFTLFRFLVVILLAFLTCAATMYNAAGKVHVERVVLTAGHNMIWKKLDKNFQKSF